MPSLKHLLNVNNAILVCLMVLIAQNFFFYMSSPDTSSRISIHEDGDFLSMEAPVPLGGIVASEQEVIKNSAIRTQYGGETDKLHLGGFTKLDYSGISENTVRLSYCTALVIV